uniref:Gag-pol polyprotein, putative n=1 Tax=Solanum demissum TaxID=50514 RepID=Q6L3X4_SOLDE|nr:Gag-pol polyprotein, putative [Solanum demissum]
MPSSNATTPPISIRKVKVGSDGTVDRLKARLVADYGETFSPITKIASVRLLISLTVMYHWPLHQLDIKNAFLHGELAEEVYMEQPPGFVAQGESNLVCRLKRSLYGLKQSLRARFGRISSVVQQFGMSQSKAYHSVFYRHNGPEKNMYLVVYVDNIIITGKDLEGMSQLKRHLFSHFQTKDLGKLKYILGIEILGIEVAQSKIESGCIVASFVGSNDQLTDILTKSLRGTRIEYICSKLGAYDMYAPA